MTEELAGEHRLFEKRTVTMYRLPKVRPKNLTFGGRYLWWRPLKVRVFIMQLIGWIEFGIRPDSVQPILLLIVRGYTSRCIL